MILSTKRFADVGRAIGETAISYASAAIATLERAGLAMPASRVEVLDMVEVAYAKGALSMLLDNEADISADVEGRWLRVDARTLRSRCCRCAAIWPLLEGSGCPVCRSTDTTFEIHIDGLEK